MQRTAGTDSRKKRRAKVAAIVEGGERERERVGTLKVEETIGERDSWNFQSGRKKWRERERELRRGVET